MASKLESIMNFMDVVLKHSVAIKDEDIQIYFIRNEILFNPIGLFTSIKQTTIEFYLKEYRSMDETSFILAHGKDPFHIMNNFDIFMKLYTEVKTKIGIPNVS